MATSNGHQPTYGGNGDAFLARFDSDGQLLWSTFYGGVGTDDANTCAVDNAGNVYMCGDAGSTGNIATGGAHQTSKGSSFTSPFLVKFNTAGVRQWGTYYSGGFGRAYNCSTDKFSNVYLAGTAGNATGTLIATPGTHQQAYAGGTGSDCFLAKFNTSGVRQWGTFYGGEKDDSPAMCFVDSVGNVFLPGSTASSNSISTPGTHQTTFAGGASDGFLVKLNPSGQRIWGTYYGGAGSDGIGGLMDKSGNILICGSTDSGSGTLIATPGTYQPSYGGGASDVFVAKLSSTGQRLWGSYYGGSGNDYGSLAGLDITNQLFIAGSTNGLSGISSAGSHQPVNGGGLSDAFLVKFNYCSPPVPVNSTTLSTPVCEGETATLSATAPGTLTWYSAASGGTVLGTGSTFITPTLSAGSFTFYVEAQTCAPGEFRTPVTFTVDACTGLWESGLTGADVKIYPNPFTEKLMIRLGANALAEVRVYDCAGSMVHCSVVSNAEDLDLSALCAGIYFVRAGSVSRKLIKE
jgi:hypothetical protein